MSKYELIETEAASTGPGQVCTRSFLYTRTRAHTHGFQFSVFMTFLSVRKTLVPSIGLFSFYLFVSSKFDMIVFVLSYNI